MNILDMQLDDHRLCNSCPCYRPGVLIGCGMDYFDWRSHHGLSATNLRGWENDVTGQLRERHDRDSSGPANWSAVSIRPQECIDNHGK